MPCCCSAGEKLLLFITINTVMSRFNWCLKALCCTFILTKQTLVWIALSLWGQRQLSPSPQLGAECSNPPLQSPSLSRQEGYFWPLRKEIEEHQEKEIKDMSTQLGGWGTLSGRELEDTFEEQHQLGGSAWVWRAASMDWRTRGRRWGMRQLLQKPPEWPGPATGTELTRLHLLFVGRFSHPLLCGH